MKIESGRYEVETIRVRLAVGEQPGEEVGGPDDAVKILRAVFAELDADQEHFVVLALNTRHRVVGFKVAASGGQDATDVDPRVVFRSALLLGAAAVIVAHNHPSGDPQPSPDDFGITDRLARAGEALGVRVLDHIVLGSAGRYHSITGRGVGR